MGDLDRRRSLTGYVFSLSGCAFSWKALLALIVALSMTKAEYMALPEAVKEAIWLRDLVSDLDLVQGMTPDFGIARVLLIYRRIRYIMEDYIY